MKKEDFFKEAIEIVNKTAGDKFAEAKIRMSAIIFMKKYNAYLQEIEENEEL